MDLLQDRALVDRGLPHLGSDSRTPPMGVDLRSLVRQVTSRHSWIVKWSSWLLDVRIHVSPVSDKWLRTHEADWNKHGMDR
jgi:hypothetical protein